MCMCNKNIVDKIIELSQNSFDMDEVPVGAVVVKNGEIIGEGMNNRENSNIISGHAEINAINSACNYIGDWRLDGCDLYVSLKPCMMCTGAIVDARIRNVYYLCDRTNVCFDAGKYLNLFKIDDIEGCNEYVNLLKLFFENKRN